MHVLVIGAAVSGRAAARLAQRRGHEVTVYDERPAALDDLEGFDHAGGTWDRSLLREVDAVIVSPGVPEHAAPVRDVVAAGLPLWSELEYASRFITAPLVAVTGTNGKTTVTLLMADMLDASGLRTVAAGNIGTALSDVAAESWDVVVVEASSFQLRFVETFHPAVSVVLNVVEDHLDWHGSFHAYLAAKANIARNADPNDPLVYDFDDVGAAKLAAGTPAQPVPVSGLERPGGGWGPESGTLVMPFGAVPMEALPVRDPAFLLDQVAAGVAAHIVGAVPDRIVGVLQRFSPSNHRRTVVGEWDGVTWIDDSKATNPHAAIAAVRAYESVVLIAGGRNKGLDLSPLVHQPNLRGVIAIGEAAAEIAVAAPPGRVTTADSMDDAVVAADGIARPGDVVLLAPGCASFDMFDSYAERGDRFAESVRRAKEGS